MGRTTPAPDVRKDVEHLTVLFELSPLGQALSSDRVILFCNQRFASNFGYESKELIGRSMSMLYPTREEFERIGERGIKVMSLKGDYHDERLMRRRDGTHVWFRVHGCAADLNRPFRLASWVFEPLSGGADTGRLTPREREVLGGMARGQTAKESAKELGLSHRTVEKLRAGLRVKFGTQNAAELMSRISWLPS